MCKKYLHIQVRKLKALKNLKLNNLIFDELIWTRESASAKSFCKPSPDNIL